MGRQRLREWMLKPLLNVEDIMFRQIGVELFSMHSDMEEVVKTILRLLERVGAVDQALARIQKCCAKPNDFLLLAKAFSSGIAIIMALQEDVIPRLVHRIDRNKFNSNKRTDYIDDDNDDDGWSNTIESYINFVRCIVEKCHIPALQNVFERITDVIDEEATFECKAIVVRRGHNEYLDNCKQQYARLKETLEFVGQGLAQRLPHLRNLMQVIFIPQVGFLVALQNPRSTISHEQQLHTMIPDDFVFMFEEGEKSFYKNSNVRELDETIGDLDAYIKDTENLILTELEEEILDYNNEIRETFHALADLDCILSFSICANEYNYVRPTIVGPEDTSVVHHHHHDPHHHCIHIKQGRHPLQEIVVKNGFQPNDTMIDNERRINIVTGPNYSGKSCYARQVGLLVYMTHIGCFIPCEEACIGVTERIIARFGTSETCSIPQSSFQLDLTHMNRCLRQGSTNSLMIVDEFGKGTSPASGIALLASALHSLNEKGCRVVCTTHFLEMFSLGIVQDGRDGIHALQMAVQTSNNGATAPLFQIEDGIANSSVGIACATISGVKPAIVERATDLLLANKEQREIEPLVEIFRRTLDISDRGMECLRLLRSTDWNNASDEEIEQFLSSIT